MSTQTKNLTPAKRWLVHRMHQTYFGTMQNLLVRDGEPVIEPPPRTKQAYKLGGKRNPPKVVAQEFALKQQHVELFELMESKRNGVIAKLTIQEGLPFLVEWETD
ncbi:MAG: hypothetical protein U0939_11965 [Pirellulales bacterium]|jgi:hypothetical protein